MNQKLAAYFDDYAQEHQHPINLLTHKIAIPVIVFHILAMLDWIPIPYTQGQISFGVLFLVGVLIWYSTMSIKYTVIMALFGMICLYLAGITPPWLVFVLAAVGWLVQLAGHAIWEKRRPSFTKNLVHALIGPLYILAYYFGETKKAVSV